MDGNDYEEVKYHTLVGNHGHYKYDHTQRPMAGGEASIYRGI